MYPEGEPADSLKAPLERSTQDFYGAPPVPDEVFQALRQIAAYDRRPLNPVTESSADLPWGAREERVTLDTIYGGERLILRLRLPDDVDPPYQAVVWFPGADCTSLRDSRYAIYHDVPNFFVKSGRALVLPVYAGTYERNDGRTMLRVREPNSRRELVLQWLRDLQRTLDYLEERPDIDGTKTAFTGFSLGAMFAPTAFAYEPRLQVGILWAGGFGTISSPEEVVAAVDQVKRITRPILMLNGRYDFIFPLETHQKPMFELLGTPEENKRHVVYDTGHWPIPRNELIKESLAWLDRYLGPVERLGS
jgi:dienelactone hydrolase